MQEGDSVKAFDRVCEVQSDKATVEITSRYDGNVAKIYHSEGDIVKVGSVLLDITQGKADSNTHSKLITESDEDTKLHIPAVKSGHAAHNAHAPAMKDSFAASNSRVQAAPAVRRMAKEYNIDLSKVPVAGVKQHVTKEDVVLYLQSQGINAVKDPRPTRQFPAGPTTTRSATTPTPVVSTPAAKPVAPVAAAAVGGEVAPPVVMDQRVPIRGVQRLMVKSMTEALQVRKLKHTDGCFYHYQGTFTNLHYVDNHDRYS